MNYFRYGHDKWLRIGRLQLGWHGRGRFRVLSERYGTRPEVPTLRVGRTAEVSVCIVDQAPSLDDTRTSRDR